ncbi:unnamed protein product [Hymenolepis diminuta]|uniref:Uncharacterized protein n=1 Tax=Hymenolepis diminuta TaxID=6216 RepID=A0A3P7BSJ9_HYMDI|nr:unnamed protein product [Hymenolepis diminuta]
MSPCLVMWSDIKAAIWEERYHENAILVRNWYSFISFINQSESVRLVIPHIGFAPIDIITAIVSVLNFLPLLFR